MHERQTDRQTGRQTDRQTDRPELTRKCTIETTLAVCLFACLLAPYFVICGTNKNIVVVAAAAAAATAVELRCLTYISRRSAAQKFTFDVKLKQGWYPFLSDHNSKPFKTLSNEINKSVSMNAT